MPEAWSAPPVCVFDDAPDPCGVMAAPWPTRRVNTPADVPAGWLVLLCTDNPARVREVCSGSPSAHVLAVCSAHVSNGAVAELLEAGAEACVRDEHPMVIRAHLVAMARRAGLGQRADTATSTVMNP